MMRGGTLLGGAVLVAALTGVGLQAADSFQKAPTPEAASLAGKDVTSPISGFAFGAVQVPVGGQVTWRNDDGAPHTVTATDKSFASDRLAGGATFTQRFTTAGTFTYVCDFHGSMKGTVVVTADGTGAANSNDKPGANPDPYAKG